MGEKPSLINYQREKQLVLNCVYGVDLFSGTISLACWHWEIASCFNTDGVQPVFLLLLGVFCIGVTDRAWEKLKTS